MTNRTNFTAEQLDAFAPVIEAHHAKILREAAAGAKYGDIALALGIKVGTVKSRLSRARAAMNRAIENNAQNRPTEVKGLDGGEEVAFD